MDFDDFLQEIILFINKAKDKERDDAFRQAVGNIKSYYTNAKTKKGEPFLTLKEAIGEDWELHCLILSTLFFITQDGACLEEIEENIILRPDIDLFLANDILTQLAFIRFPDRSLRIPYSRSREINRHLLERFEKEYPFQIPYLPYEKRNKKRIIIETDTLLGYNHAPTRIVLEVCQTLIRDMGYEVFLLINVSEMNYEWMNQFWLFPSAANYRKDIRGGFSIQYEDVTIRSYQLILSKNSIEEMRQLAKELYEWAPLCVWQIGSPGYRHDALRQLTTVLSKPCIVGYSVSEAPVLLSGSLDDSTYIKNSIDYALKSNQKLLSVKIVTSYKEQGKNYQKEDFEIPNDAFVISIVGNRLDGEVSEEFAQMLEDVAKQTERIYFAVIGKYKKKFFKHIEENRVKYLGFREDLLDIIKITDLFVNPPRQGGGISSTLALSVGVPVVTLPHCDVAVSVGADFCCEDLTKMQQLIYKYGTDADFYKSQQEKAYARHRERMEINNADNFKKMLQQVNDWLENGDLS